ncbi:REST corepressor 1 [Schistosoma japonicum]|uniref:REST corepressor 1 n=2 Tax=Schistosoma japonicum TaxID=6182 RepID=A0A4Z2CYW4_SCHJA|nr:REST corepressor 1 [Schistosoma japonicum]
MIKRPAVVKAPKTYKSRKSQEDGCSRVGINFQAEIPEHAGKISNDDKKNFSSKEFIVWAPNLQPNLQELSSYLEFAKQHQYTQELALILLHWHNYNISDAIDDIPNYVPVYNKWTKGEVKKFLRCIDSKPRKNFVEAKKTVPGRHMGDICALYYAIAAPFKARTRNKYHSELIEQCFSRAVRNGLVAYRLGKSASPGDTNTNGRRFGQAEDPLEREIESYLINIIGVSKTAHLLGKDLMSTPYPIQPSGNQNLTSKSVQNTSSSSPLRSLPFSSAGRENESSSPSVLLPTNTYQTSSSEASSQIGSESLTQRKVNRHILPNGAYYDHDEFMAFLSMSNDQLVHEKETELADLERIKEELCEQIEITEARSRSVLYKMELLKPVEGFPQISYRWTKTELAFVLTAMNKYGQDFSTIARTVGTKSESFIRDFYNTFRDRFTLNSIMKPFVKTNGRLIGHSASDRKSMCQEPSVVGAEDRVDETEKLTDETISIGAEKIKQDPANISESAHTAHDNLKTESDESTPDKQDGKVSNNIRLSSRRRTASSKFVTPEVLSHNHQSESPPSSPQVSLVSRGRGRGRAKRLRRS